MSSCVLLLEGSITRVTITYDYINILNTITKILPYSLFHSLFQPTKSITSPIWYYESYLTRLIYLHILYIQWYFLYITKCEICWTYFLYITKSEICCTIHTTKDYIINLNSWSLTNYSNPYSINIIDKKLTSKKSTHYLLEFKFRIIYKTKLFKFIYVLRIHINLLPHVNPRKLFRVSYIII